ncbi:hypothetical protein BY996DRAFT_6494216 [Phakopsora pachyrhizi]|nr:hypothetical protein BY996DRAFT_6494216 [Phakopsora pachyrhizi]
MRPGNEFFNLWLAKKKRSLPINVENLKIDLNLAYRAITEGDAGRDRVQEEIFDLDSLFINESF